MGISAARYVEALRHGFARWLSAWRPQDPDPVVAPIARPATGLSSETFFVEVDWSGGTSECRQGTDAPASLVARLPPLGEGLFPVYDLSSQATVQGLVARAGVPAVLPLAVELDDAWIGAPFLLMARVKGRVVQAEEPFLRRGWLAEADGADQAHLHSAFLDVLAAIHRIPTDGGAFTFLPGGDENQRGGVLAGEIDRWDRYLTWAADGEVPSVFAEALGWCRRHLPWPEPAGSLLWGDVQLGNVLVADDFSIAAVLDFEMASVGPAELDLAWFLVLHRMTVERCGRYLPGFPDRSATIDAYERRLGRPVADLRWFEVFAALRSGAIMVRAARLLARLGVDDSWLLRGNPTVDLLETLIAG